MASRASRYVPVASASFDQRRMERHVVAVSRVTTRRHGQQAQDARLHDISTFGCRLVTGERHEPGERLWLRFGGAAAVAATVVWSDAGAAGCRFDDRIPGSLVRSMTLDAY